VPVVAVSSVPPPTGIEDLAEAIEEHRERTDLAERRLRSRRLSALREFVTEHGEGGLRRLGGRREAGAFLGGRDPDESVSALREALEGLEAKT
jgi:LAO/AO transport system kinase